MSMKYSPSLTSYMMLWNTEHELWQTKLSKGNSGTRAGGGKALKQRKSWVRTGVEKWQGRSTVVVWSSLTCSQVELCRRYKHGKETWVSPVEQWSEIVDGGGREAGRWDWREQTEKILAAEKREEISVQVSEVTAMMNEFPRNHWEHESQGKYKSYE